MWNLSTSATFFVVDCGLFAFRASVLKYAKESLSNEKYAVWFDDCFANNGSGSPKQMISSVNVVFFK